MSIETEYLHSSIEQQRRNIFYYQQEWLDMIRALYGYQLLQLTTRDAESQLTGWLPLYMMNSPLTGRRLVSLPFSDYCPLLASNEAATDDLLTQAIDIARENKARYLELRTGNAPEKSSLLIAGDDLYVRWLLPLADNEDAMWSQLRKPVQHQIKKARKAGVQVRIARRREEMQQYYHLHLLTRTKKHGMPAQPERFFLELWDRFAWQQKVTLLLADYQEQCIAGMILLRGNTTAQYAYGASDEHYLSLAPNNLLMWTAITWSIEQKCTMLDMGRTNNANEGLMEYKRRWGAIKEPLTYYYYPAQNGLAATSEQSWKYRLLTACWRKLPLSIAGQLGSKLYRHMG